MQTICAESQQAQEALGAALAQACPESCVIFLEGDLGAGKTTLTRGFLRSLGHRGAVRSPTYTLLEPYLLGTRTCYHLDLYRLGDAQELEYLGLRDLLEDPAVLLVEWPERGEGELPAPDLRIRIRYAGDGRCLDLDPGSAVGAALLALFSGQIAGQVVGGQAIRGPAGSLVEENRPGRNQRGGAFVSYRVFPPPKQVRLGCFARQAVGPDISLIVVRVRLGNRDLRAITRWVFAGSEGRWSVSSIEMQEDVISNRSV